MVRWNLAVVVGVPGVGKTSLCIEASQSLGYQYINFGELMLKFAREQELASNQEEMFKLPLDLQYEIWRKSASHIKDRKGVLVDLHGLDRSKKGYIISLPIELLTPEIIILVESSYHNIIKRRISDQDRSRPIEKLNIFKEEKELLRNTLVTCSILTGSFFVILENNEFNESLNRLKKYL